MRVDDDPVLVAQGHAWKAWRVRDPGATRAACPSLALDPAFVPLEKPGEPVLGVTFADGASPWDWSLSVDAGEADLYGLGEVPGPFRRNGRPVECWNTDDPAYEIDAVSLYQSHPWVFGMSPDGSAFGVLIDTTWRCRIEPEGTIRVHGRGVEPNVYLVEGDAPESVTEALAALTGRIARPPRWAMGYHQCRWSYEPASRVLEIARGFRERRIPCDAIWMDIDYMDGFRCFTFDPEGFADPKALCNELHDLGFHTVWMIDPGIKADPGYSVYDAGSEIDAWVKTPEGEPFVGQVWPGDCVFPDFTRADVRSWWGTLYRDWLSVGVDGVWNDMNEPAVFDQPGKYMPENMRHQADTELGGPDAHARYHNVYGLLMVRASRAGILKARPEARPFVLTRANFIGGHRYAATWTGDNESTWENLAWSIPMILNLGLSGQAMSGPDIGGFNGEADGALFARWMGIGSLLPFARAHTIMGSGDHEPWSFGPECERICRLAIERRMRLLGYLYTLADEAARTGVPIARPLSFADPADPALRDVDDSFLLGRDLLVRARVREAGDCTAPMPAGAWKPLDAVIGADPELPTLWVREGAVIPLLPVMQHAGERPIDEITLAAHLDADGRATGSMYEDGSLNEGPWRQATFTIDGSGVHEASEGELEVPVRTLTPVVL